MTRRSSLPDLERARLPVPRLIEALGAWQREPSDAARFSVARELEALARHVDVACGHLVVEAPPLPRLDLVVTEPEPAGTIEHPLREPSGGEVVGTVRVAGEPAGVATLLDALEAVIGSVRAAARADRAERQMAALDQAVRGIAGVLDLDRVLELIVEHVRELVDARYAALGIVDASGAITQFFTSGINDEECRAIGELPHGRGLLGLIIRENRTYRIPDITKHPASYGFPPNHPTMRSFLGTPISTRRGPIGRLYLTEKIGAPEFSAQDQELVEMFARHAGIAIENAHLHDQVRRLAVVDERDRISRDLHDSVIQAIYAQTLALDDVPDLIEDDPAEARRRVDDSIDALHAVIRDIRNFIFGLRPVLLESGTLADGLRHLATELRRSGAVPVEVAVEDPHDVVPGLPLETVAELLTVVREALSNIARHAEATSARVALTADEREVRLEIVDDGRGFDPSAHPDRGHHGLANMRARVTGLGGRFEVDSGPSGTRIMITLAPGRSSNGGEDR